MTLQITLAPDGGLRLILPGGRGLNVGTSAAAMHFIRRILLDVREGKPTQRGYIGEFPTQHIIDIWRKQDFEAREAVAVERAEAQRAEFEARGIDLEALDIQL